MACMCLYTGVDMKKVLFWVLVIVAGVILGILGTVCKLEFIKWYIAR